MIQLQTLCLLRPRVAAGGFPHHSQPQACGGGSGGQALLPSPEDLSLSQAWGSPAGAEGTGERKRLPRGQLGAAYLWQNRGLTPIAQERQDGRVGRAE